MEFLQVQNIAVVGISDKPERDSNKVAHYLIEQGFSVIPVNPALDQVLGLTCYPSLLAIPPELKVDVVTIFRRPDQVEPVVQEAIQRGVKTVWMQLGVINPEAAAKAEAAGLEVVMDKCIKIEHGKWKENGAL
ncbi:MAG: CoA-binding protein [Syntrophomonadaceae bacterium]|nr:CoA-binding protein [Syntrophomonadaceae bacterium]